MRHSISLSLNQEDLVSKLLNNLKEVSVYCVLNSNKDSQDHSDKYHRYDLLAGIEVLEKITPETNSFEAVQNFYLEKKDWLFGHFNYDLKDELEKLSSSNHDRLGIPPLYFFRPKYVLSLNDHILKFEYLPEYTGETEAKKYLENLLRTSIKATRPNENELKTDIRSQVTEQVYLDRVKIIKEHIQRGDIYEMNYCTEFFSEKFKVDPVEIYLRLNQYSPMPFSAFYKLPDHYALCGSPERFIAKRKDKIISQPIKGTARRGTSEQDDMRIKENLRTDPKEKAENVMIVDLVRNDLSKTAQKGSVIVEELFAVKSFKRLHQMISTITSHHKPEINFTDIIRHAFPMGSMTGAPKVRAMQIIEDLEQTKRGLYSGSIGYIDPAGDFDFNVVIRTILYNSTSGALSFMVGSAITANSDPEAEYKECLLKAESMKMALRKSFV
ncbi:MAG TPA: aminodeoxychorismate synthase component I [Bacteroidia bacterium]|nr:aminodeoxychorismate synthase component I [Bacteroidia bacterium]HNS11673.1 aminodeoxychorismate synthase component I [Bacteroidia bacterium]